MRRIVIIFSLFFLGALTWLAWRDIFLHQGFSLSMLNVGQGDALFLESPQGHQILIDGGPDESVVSELGRRMPFWDRTVDLVILTHAEADHLSGLIEVLKRFKVGTILWTGITKDTRVVAAWIEALKKEDASIVLAKAGLKVRWSNDGGEFLQVLYPESIIEKNMSVNETSIIAKLHWQGRTALFTGDTTARVEKKLIQDGVDIKADILKIAHHGSATSTSWEFVEKVNPTTALISAGKDNTYRHPTPYVLELLQQYGIQIVRTDEQGTITLTFNK